MTMKCDRVQISRVFLERDSSSPSCLPQLSGGAVLKRTFVRCETASAGCSADLSRFSAYSYLLSTGLPRRLLWHSEIALKCPEDVLSPTRGLRASKYLVQWIFGINDASFEGSSRYSSKCARLYMSCVVIYTTVSPLHSYVPSGREKREGQRGLAW